MPSTLRILHFIITIMWATVLIHPCLASEATSVNPALIQPNQLPTHLVTVDPRPEWVIEQSWSMQNSENRTQAKNRYFLLVDEQIYFKHADQQSFRHYAYQILNENGLSEGGTLKINFDPSYAKLSMHFIKIHRDGNIINIDVQKHLKILQRETELERSLFDGELSAVFILENLKKADIVEYAFTEIGQNPVFDDHIFAYKLLNWSDPVQHIFYRFLFSDNKKVNAEFKKSDWQLTKKNANGLQDWTLDKRDVAGVHFEADTPNWYTPYASLHLTEFSSWGQINDWANSLFMSQQDNSSLYEKTLANIHHQEKTDDVLIADTIRFVQNEIRYIGIEMGTSSYQPHSPSWVLEKRFGDCKDKSLLATHLLKIQGFNAYPVLVNTELGTNLNEFPPLPNLFDHVIVMVEFKNKKYWFDVTRTGEMGDLSTLIQDDYGYGLVLGYPTKELIPLHINKPFYQEQITENYDLSNISQPVKLLIESWYDQQSAKRNKTYFESNTLSDIQKNYLAYYDDYFSNIDMITPIKYQEEFRSNRVKVSEEYAIDQAWKPYDENYQKFNTYAYQIRQWMNFPEERKRTTPFKLKYPVDIQQVQNFKLPESHFDEIDNKCTHIKNEFFIFSNCLKKESTDVVRIEYKYKTLKTFVPATDIPKFLIDLDAAWHETSFTFYNEIDKSGYASIEDWLTLFGFACLLLGWIGFGIIGKNRKKIYLKEKEIFFFAVSIQKFIVMNLLSLGYYGLFWYYMNWSYLKERQSIRCLPVLNGCFKDLNFYWFYLRYNKVTKGKYYENNPFNWMMLFFSILNLSVTGITILTAMEKIHYGWQMLYGLSWLLFLPLLTKINQQNTTKTINQHSEYGCRHVLLILLSISALVYGNIN